MEDPWEDRQGQKPLEAVRELDPTNTLISDF
jgi:hypothetical protein